MSAMQLLVWLANGFRTVYYDSGEKKRCRLSVSNRVFWSKAAVLVKTGPRGASLARRTAPNADSGPAPGMRAHGPARQGPSVRLG